MESHGLAGAFESEQGTVRWGRFGAGPPVVLMHGTPFSSVVWRDVATALARRYRVHVWDMPGYGQSEKAEGRDVSLAAQQEVFTGLLKHWGVDRPAVVAHDVGGAVALRSALFDGVRYASLALLDAVVLHPWGTDFFHVAGDHPGAFTALPAHLHEALVRAHIRTASHNGLPAALLEELTAPWLGPAGQRAFYRQAVLNDEKLTTEITQRLGELSLPVLVGWGREDRWLPAEQAERLARQLPQAELHLLENAGHLVQFDAPARLMGILGPFLAASA